MTDLAIKDSSDDVEEKMVEKRLPTKEECDLLVNATYYGDMEVVTRLSNDGVDMDAIIHEEYQQTPLHVTAGYGHDNIVKKLISLHVNIECVDHKRWTPLHKAAKNGHNNVAILLLAANANVNCQTEDNFTPLHMACGEGHALVVTTLLHNNANIECRTNDNSTPLYVAAQDGHNEVVKLLLQSNADVNCVCKAQATPLSIAAEKGDLMVVKTLLAYNAKVDCVDVFNKTSLQYAVEKEKSDVVKCLVEHGKIDINEFDQNYKEKIEKLLRESFNEKLLEETSKDNHSGSPTTQKVTNQEKKAYRLAMRDGLAKSSTLRLLVFGPENSGKTCLISTLFEEAFQQNSATQGADVQICTIYAANWCKCSAKEMAEKLQVKFFHKLNTTAQEQAESPSFHATSVDDKEGIASKMKRLFFMSSKAATSQPHKAPEINIEEIKQAKCIEITSEDEFHAVVWDFAGQIEYLNAHTIFVRRHNLVFLVFKASCNLSDPIEARPGDKKASQKVTHFKVIHYWLQTVTSVCNEDGGVNHKSELLPTVVLIATHIDEIEGDVEQAKEDIITQLAKELEGKPYAKHLAGNREGLLDALRKYCFFISNKVRDTKVINRLKEIVQQAATPILEEEHPLVYINIEKRLLSLEKDVITTTEFHKVALENGFVANKNSAEIKGALNYFHHKGAILHFDTTDSLKELVFLSPQWLEKLFAFLVIAHPYKPTVHYNL
ncbi:death-associated protein kinase 1-like isoform X2 [Dysidea avara]|uniref:death-associated protein kinase 1-like isoform X2 n=1 Tax=Dysidea avara TaxID=196820 RepID=UPI0033290F22